MLPLGFSRRTLLIGLSGLVLIISTVTVLTTLIPKEQMEDRPEHTASNKATNRVFIKDFHKYGNYFSEQKQLAVENVLYTYVSQRNTVPDLYTGVIRPGSFSETVDPNGTPNIRFLVDISPVNVTYILGTPDTVEKRPGSVLIQCAPEDQQKNPSFPCIDGMKYRE